MQLFAAIPFTTRQVNLKACKLVPQGQVDFKAWHLLQEAYTFVLQGQVNFKACKLLPQGQVNFRV